MAGACELRLAAAGDAAGDATGLAAGAAPDFATGDSAALAAVVGGGDVAGAGADCWHAAMNIDASSPITVLDRMIMIPSDITLLEGRPEPGRYRRFLPRWPTRRRCAR